MESEHLTETTDPLNDVANTLWFEPPIRGQPEQQYLIYFITGNPGLISLYAIFMNTLSGLLNQSSTSPIHVCGSSLPGFGTAGLDSEVESKIPAGLEEQITNTEQLIHKTVKHHEELMPYATGYVPPKVILMGHSIGCYILLEILRRQRAGPGRLEGVEIAGGIMLFPAIVDIGKSWNGRIFRMLCAIPYFIAVVVGISKVCAFLFSVENLVTLFRLFVNMPLIVARTTAEFLHSQTGVEEALFMANTEMHIVKEDKWSDDVWGSEEHAGRSSETVPLVFFFGGKDGWVSSDVRDDIIMKRGRSSLGVSASEDWKPKMVVDEHGIPHGFVIGHSQILAEKTQKWVEEIVKIDRAHMTVATKDDE